MASIVDAEVRYQIVQPPTLSLQSGLYEQVLQLSNDGAADESGVRLFVDGLPQGVELWNRDGSEDQVPFVTLPDLEAGASRQFTLEYYDPLRSRVGEFTDLRIEGGGPPAFQFVGEVGATYTGHFGDVDRDGDITSNDVLLVTQHLSGLRLLDSASEQPNADIDHDGDIDGDDVALIAKTAISGNFYPRALVPAAGPAGKIVQLYDERLSDMAAEAVVSVAGTELPEITRIYPGVASFMIPPIYDEDQVLDVVLAIEGEEVATHQYQLQLQPLLSPAEFRSQLDTAVMLLEEKTQEACDQIDLVFGLPRMEEIYEYENRLRIQETEKQVLRLMSEALAELKALLDQVPDEVMPIVISAFQANAPELEETADLFDRLLAERGGRSGRSVTQADRTFLRATCKLTDLLGTVDDIFKYAGWACIGVSAISLACGIAAGSVTGGVGAVVCGAAFLTAAVTACTKLVVVDNIRGVITPFIPTVNDSFIVTGPAYSTMSDGRTAARFTLQVEIDLFWRKACQADGEEAVKEAIEEIIETGLEKAMQRSALYRKVIAPVKRRAPELADEIDDAVNDIREEAGTALVLETRLGKALVSWVQDLCDLAPSISGIPVDHTEVKVKADPNVGTIRKEVSEIVFECPDDPPNGGIELEFTLDECGEIKGSAEVECQDEVEVRFTIGDNGNLLDDIFELVINGDSVLTSGSPTRGVSTTVSLVPGVHQMAMIGRAAPDGIGTYFVSVNGARVVGGPPLSGDNLSAGTRFSWTIEVDPPAGN